MSTRHNRSGSFLNSIRFHRRAWRERAIAGAFLLLSFGAYWIDENQWLLACAVAFPAIILITRSLGGFDSDVRSLDSVTRLPQREHLEQMLQRSLRDVDEKNLNTACFFIELDGFRPLSERYGDAAAEQVLRRVADRVSSVLRDTDAFSRVGDARFAAALYPVRHLDLEICIQLAARIQAAVEEPIIIDNTTIYTTCCIGFCLANRAPEHSVSGLTSAASMALVEAQRHGASTIRAFSANLQRMAVSRHKLLDDATQALEKGEIRAWFQPQTSTDTGRVSGFEALARWEHPKRGVIPPADFLEALEQSGQMERLGDLMLHLSLTAMKSWDSAGHFIPHIGVNFSSDELRNPALIDKIKWELDRFDLTPDRLSVEVLETVVSGSPDDIINRNINGLAKLGCRIDLDDFGTGHASISSIRRFAVSRLKIDRSFVMRADQDKEQQRIISAIITMAERLGLETLAEGIETSNEHAMLAQLGCGHVQGYGISRPMPFNKTIQWIEEHNAKLQNPPQIGGQSG